MTKHQIQTADGIIHIVEAPDDTPPEQLFQLVPNQSSALHESEPPKIFNYESSTVSERDQTQSDVGENKSGFLDAFNVIIVALVIGVFFLYLLKPKTINKPSDIARKWLAYFIFLEVSVSSNKYSSDGLNSALYSFFLVGIPLGILIYLAGMFYGSFVKYSNISPDKKISSQNFEKDILDSNSQSETELYLKAVEEYESETRNKSLWAKCFAIAEGDESKTKALYLRQHVKNASLNCITTSSIPSNHINQTCNSEIVHMIENNLLTDFEATSIEKHSTVDLQKVSDRFLLQNKRFKIFNRGSKKIMVLENGHVAIQVDKTIMIFENEKWCLSANLNETFPGGLIATIKASDLQN